jgi:hypothetical protein
MNRPLTRKDALSFSLISLIIALQCLLLHGCTSFSAVYLLPEIYPSNQLPPYVRQISHVRVYANMPSVDTGIDIRKDEFYTIVAEGEIRLSPQGKARTLPISAFAKFIDKRYFGAVFSWEKGGTYRWPDPGRLYLGIRDSYYADNYGYFDAVIITWNTDDWSKIFEFLKILKERMPRHEGILDAYAEAQARSEIEIAKDNTSKEIVATKQEIEAVLSEKGQGAKAERQQQLKALETRQAELMAKMSHLDALTQQLQEQRIKVTELSRQLEEIEGREKLLLGKISQAAKAPPLLLITEPEDESRHETDAVRLLGAAEDDSGLERLEILINGVHAESVRERILKTDSGEAPRGYNFNKTVQLAPGSNLIEVKAIDTDGLVSEKIIKILYTPSRRNVWALVVGINEYPKLPRLKYAVNDAREFQRLLVEKNRVPAENVFLLLNAEATLGNLRSVLGTQLRSAASKDDMVIIFFAGHGATERDALSPDGDGLEKYLLPWEADLKDLYSTAIPMREIAYILDRIQSERLIFIADACYSGASGGRTVGTGGLRATISETFLERLAGGRGKVILTASAVNEVSVEKNELQHGVFTYYLLEGLRGGADMDRDGMVTVDEAYRYVSKEVPQATGQEQHPVKKGTVEGSMVLSIVR